MKKKERELEEWLREGIEQGEEERGIEKGRVGRGVTGKGRKREEERENWGRSEGEGRRGRERHTERVMRMSGGNREREGEN